MAPKRSSGKIILLAALTAVVAILLIAAAHGENQNGRTLFAQFVIAGGPVVWFILLPLSVVTVSLAAEFCLTIRRSRLLPPQAARDIVTIMQRHGPERLRKQLAQKTDFISVAVRRLIENAGRHLQHGRAKAVLSDSLQQQALRLLRKIEWANIIGNVAPMIGLFGTVFGMIKTFNSIVAAGGQPQPDQLAGGISVALVTTLWGLMVAIPALVIHGIFRNRIEAFAAEAAEQTEAILSRLTTEQMPDGRQRPSDQIPAVDSRRQTAPAEHKPRIVAIKPTTGQTDRQRATVRPD